jgi:hypothetical protein
VAVKALRREADLTQKQLGERIGLHEAYISSRWPDPHANPYSCQKPGPFYGDGPFGLIGVLSLTAGVIFSSPLPLLADWASSIRTTASCIYEALGLPPAEAATPNASASSPLAQSHERRRASSSVAR